MTDHPQIGLGLAALGRPAYLTTGRAQLGAVRTVEAMRARTVEVLGAAYAGGIRYIDAARSYGLAEDFLAGWLAARPDVDDVHVASKWGYRYVGEWRMEADAHEVKDHSMAAFDAQVGETRALLGDRLDLYQVHSVTEDSPLLGDRVLQQALARFGDESGVALGISTSGPRQADAIRAALDLDVGGRRLFSSVQSTWNILEPSAGPALAEAARAGVSVVVKECFANGRLAPGGDDGSATVRVVANLAADLGIPIDQLAIAAAVSQPWSPRVLSGAITAAQVASHLAGSQYRPPLAALDSLVPLGKTRQSTGRHAPDVPGSSRVAECAEEHPARHRHRHEGASTLTLRFMANSMCARHLCMSAC